MQAKLLTPIALLTILGIPSQVLAHGMSVESRRSEAQVYEIKAIYDTGEAAKNAQVAIYPPGDAVEPQISGFTDAEGRFWFATPQAGEWEVQVLQAGHGDRISVSVSPQAQPEPAAQEASPSPSPKAERLGQSDIASQTSRSNYTPLQKALMIGAIVWGCVGTALFFMRGKKG